MTPRLPLATLLLAVAAPAMAEGGISLAVAGSGIGVGPVAGVRLSPALGAHGDAALVAVSHHFQTGTTRDADHLKLRTAAAMLDLFPFGGGFRMSVGARYEGEQAPFGDPAPVGRARDVRGWTSMGPAATLGWTRRLARGLVAALEGGAVLRRDGSTALAAFRPGPILNATLGWRF